MQGDDMLKILADHRDELYQKFGVKSLTLFGCAVDVGTLDSLKPRIRARVLAESMDVS